MYFHSLLQGLGVLKAKPEGEELPEVEELGCLWVLLFSRGGFFCNSTTNAATVQKPSQREEPQHLLQATTPVGCRALVLKWTNPGFEPA